MFIFVFVARKSAYRRCSLQMVLTDVPKTTLLNYNAKDIYSYTFYQLILNSRLHDIKMLQVIPCLYGSVWWTAEIVTKANEHVHCPR